MVQCKMRMQVALFTMKNFRMTRAERETQYRKCCFIAKGKFILSGNYMFVHRFATTEGKGGVQHPHLAM